MRLRRALPSEDGAREAARMDWPEGRTFALCLTHDVDRVRKTYHYLTHLVRTRRTYHLASLLSRREPYWNFERLMEVERRHGVRSTFFFLDESRRLSLARPREWHLALGRYDVRQPKVAEVIRGLHRDGWEVGLHGSYDSYLDGGLLRREKEALEGVLGQRVVGIRQHYLNLDVPATWRLQEEAGFAYDASFGLKGRVGFREGRCLPFHPFEGRPFLVLPLAIMDRYLLGAARGTEDAWRRCLEVVDAAERSGGLLTALWHQELFNEDELPGSVELYERLLSECERRNAWVARARDVAEWVVGHGG